MCKCEVGQSRLSLREFSLRLHEVVRGCPEFMHVPDNLIYGMVCILGVGRPESTYLLGWRLARKKSEP